MSFPPPPPPPPQLADINTGDHENDVAGSDQIDPHVDILSHPPQHEDEDEDEEEGSNSSRAGAGAGAATERVEYYMPYDPLDFTHLIPSVSVSVDAGLSEEVVAAFLNLNLKSMAGHSDLDGEVCSVCLDELQSSHQRKLVVLPRCRHAFHAQCIGNWLLNNNTCPLCKSIALDL